MEKNMKLFQTTQKNLAIIYFSPNQSDSFIALIRQHWSCFFQSSLSLTSLSVYLVHDANTTKEFMDSMFLTTSAILIFVSFTSTVFKTTELYAFFNDAEEAANQRLENCPESKGIYQKVNRQVELLSEIIYIVMVKFSLPAFLLPLAVLSYYRYFFTGLGNEAFMLTVPTWFPFDWKSPIGYAIALTLQLKMYLNPFRYFACFASLGFGSFWFINSFIKDVSVDLHTISDLSRKHQLQSKAKMIKTLNNFICTHSDLKQLIDQFMYLYETTFTAVIAGCTLLISISILTIQIEISLNGFDMVQLLISIFYGLFVCLLLFAACEIGERGTSLFIEIDDVLVQSDWYFFPLKIQKMLPTLMINTQRPVVIKCFGSVSCTREQFKKLVNASYQYFMLLHKFYK